MIGDCYDGVQSDMMFPYSCGCSDEIGAQSPNCSVKPDRESYDEWLQ
jgi:hypothetical protein